MIARMNRIQDVGTVSILKMEANVKDGLMYSPISTDNKKETNYRGPVSSFVGVGGLGNQVGMNLLQPRIQKENENLPYSYHPISTGLMNHLKGNHLIFVIGDSCDPEFHPVRNLAVAAKPKLLITVVLDNPCKQEYYGYMHPSECIIVVPPINVLSTTSYIIQDIFTAIALPGLICLDFRDVIDVLAGKQGLCFLVKSDIDHSLSIFSEAVLNRSEELSKSSWSFCYFSYDHKYEDELDWQHLEKNMELLFDVSPKSAEILFGANVISEQNTPYRATVIITQ